MDITFQAESATITVGDKHYSGLVTVCVDAKGQDIAAELDVDDRLHNLEMRDIIDEVGSTKLLDAITPEEFTEWVSKSNSDGYIDLLNAIGLEAIHEHLSHID